MRKVISVSAESNNRLYIEFDTGEVRIFDVSPYIVGSWYGKLADPKYFGNVQPCGDTVSWPDGQDIAPHELYELSIPLSQQRGN